MTGKKNPERWEEKKMKPPSIRIPERKLLKEFQKGIEESVV